MTPEEARNLAESLQGHGHNVPKPVTDEWVEQAAERGMIRRADLINGAWYIGCCRNAYMARWFADAKHTPRARWSISYDGDEWSRSEVMPRTQAEAEAAGARVANKSGDDYDLAITIHDGACTDTGCSGLDAHDGCFPKDPRKGAFIHMRVKFGSVFTEVINHPEDDDGWDVFVPTLMVLGPM